MKTRVGTKCLNVLVVMLFILGIVLNGVAPVLAQTGAIAAAATASDTAPDVGDTITVSINIDMTGTPELLGSYTGSFSWDPAVLSYVSYSGAPPTGFTGVVNVGSVGAGTITFNGANASGGSGNLIVLVVTFNVLAAGSAELDLAFTVMAAALTFANLVPILSVSETPVVVPGEVTGVVEVDGVASSGTGAANASSVSFAHTTGTGNNRLMVVGVSWNCGATSRTITGVTFTPTDTGISAIAFEQVILFAATSTSAPRYAAIWKSVTEPPSNEPGTVTVAFSGSVANGIVAGAANFANVDLTDPIDGSNGATAGSGTAPSVTLGNLEGDELVFDTVFMGGSGSSQTLTADSSQSEVWDEFSGNTRGAASIEQAAGSSVSMDWTAGSSAVWVIAAAGINPAGGGETPTCYALTLTKSGFYSGTPATADLVNSPGCPAGEYVEGQVIGLTAHPDWGYEVQSWTGTDADSSTELTNVLTMPASAHSVDVSYQSKACYHLERTSGEHGSAPTANPDFSLACTNGSDNFVEGEAITLTAHPDTGYRVASWSGTDDDESTELTNTLTMPALVSAVHVTYEEIPPRPTLDGPAFYTASNANTNTVNLTVTTGIGQNRLMLVGVSYNSSGATGTKPYITSVTYTPDGGSAITLDLVLDQWSPPTSTTDPGRMSAIYILPPEDNPPAGTEGTLTVTFSASFTTGVVVGAANFQQVDQTDPLGEPNSAATSNDVATVSVDVTTTGNELVFDNLWAGGQATTPAWTISPDVSQSALWSNPLIGNTMGAASTKEAAVGTTTMTWTRSASGYLSLVAVPINPAVSVATQQLTMAVTPAGGGTVTPAVGTYVYPQGTVVILLAVPATGYTFSHWTPDEPLGDPIADPYAAYTTVTMNADVTVTAHFAPTTHTVTFMPNGATGGTMAPQTASVPTALTSNTFTRTGYVFVNWNTAVDGSGIDYADGADYDFSEDITLYAQWTDLGTIIIEKQTIPDGQVQTFQFTGDLTGTISDGQQIVVNGLAAGTYQIEEVVYTNQWKLQSIVCDDLNSTPDLPANSVDITLEAGETVKCVFTNRMPMDYGDAPDSYKTLYGSGGAGHLYSSTAPMLGGSTDWELDGHPSTLANGDDNDGSDDEEGVSFTPSTLVAGSQAQVTIDAFGSGKLDAWIDYNGDGDFDHPAELFLGATIPISSGAGHAYSFVVPANAVIGSTYARFRLSTAGSLLPSDIAADGEVEDYRVEIVAPTSHTVTFMPNGATSGAMDPQTASAPTALTLNAFLRTGYAFSGWNTTALGNGTAYTDGQTYSFATDLTLYAQWTANTYTVTFNANSGETPTPASKIVTYGSAYGELATTSRTGFTFAGWFTAASGGTEVTSATLVATASNHTLYAHWTANTYTVTFSANSGETPTPTSKIVTYGSAYGTLAATSRTGFTFAGWFTAAGGGTEVTATTVVTSASNHTLYAHWTANTYTVSFDANGGNTPVPISKDVTFGSAYGTLATTSRTGYTFIGWYTSASGGSQVTAATIVTTAADHTLYAQWTTSPVFTVTFNANGGSGSMEPQTANVPTALTLNSFTRLGYSFTGWNTVAGGGGTAYGNGAMYNFDADIILFAQWQIENHTITFNSNGGTGSMSTQISNVPAAITLNAFLRAGFSFTGWNTVANGSGVSYADGATYSFAADITLYAQWRAQPIHSINLEAGWNLVSFNLIPDDPDIEVALADILDDVILVYAWNGSTDSWLRFDPDVTFGNTLLELHETMGFWINMAQEVTLPIAGTEPITTNIPLYSGWNLVGYPAVSGSDLPGALSAISGKYNLVMAFHADDLADPWKLFDPAAPVWVNDLTAMEPGWGYWIDATEAANLPVVFE